MSGKRERSTNLGIQANNVVADVIAVGDHANASKTVQTASLPDLVAALAMIQRHLEGIVLDPLVRSKADAELKQANALAKVADREPAAFGAGVRRLAGVLRSAGLLASAASGLLEPFKRIASMLGVPLSYFGF